MSELSWSILKEKGNEEFKKGNFNIALDYYSQAIGMFVVKCLKFSIK